jgi:hypothetical protein
MAKHVEECIQQKVGLELTEVVKGYFYAIITGIVIHLSIANFDNILGSTMFKLVVGTTTIVVVSRISIKAFEKADFVNLIKPIIGVNDEIENLDAEQWKAIGDQIRWHSNNLKETVHILSYLLLDNSGHVISKDKWEIVWSNLPELSTWYSDEPIPKDINLNKHSYRYICDYFQLENYKLLLVLPILHAIHWYQTLTK